jgi:hypothetical protein
MSFPAILFLLVLGTLSQSTTPQALPLCDAYCKQKTTLERSYCKYWLRSPVCFGSETVPCPPELCVPQTTSAPPLPPCDEYCRKRVDSSSYCKSSEMNPTCFGDDSVMCGSDVCDLSNMTMTTSTTTTTPTLPLCDQWCKQSTGIRDSYCKYWLQLPVCFGNDTVTCPTGSCVVQTTTTMGPASPTLPLCDDYCRDTSRLLTSTCNTTSSVCVGAEDLLCSSDVCTDSAMAPGALKSCDSFCQQEVGDLNSYCKYWQERPSCYGAGDVGCGQPLCEVVITPCDSYCRDRLGTNDTYCQRWLPDPTCFGDDRVGCAPTDCHK